MKPDYKRFTINREIFPRQEQYNCNRLICGHLNRLKFPTDIDTYLKNRKEKKSMISSLARANKCFCRQEDIPKNEIKDELNRIEMAFEQTKNLVQALQNIQIVLPKEKNFDK